MALKHTPLRLTLNAVDLTVADKAALDHFQRNWRRYADWFFAEERGPGPDGPSCRAALAHHMPNLIPTFDQLVGLLPAQPDRLTRFLSLYRPPAFLTGCSQAVWRSEGTHLLRNYDYYPERWEATVLFSDWLQPVLCLSDCFWGVLDGINGSGLAVSLAFGGSPHLGDGFGITVILRYLLETCHSVDEALVKLAVLQSHMAYNITLADATGHAVTVQMKAGGTVPTVYRKPLAANHQTPIIWREYAERTASMDRELFLLNRLRDPKETLSSLERHFLGRPLYHQHYRRGFGTLYTAHYHCQTRELTLLWPDQRLTFRTEDFQAGKHPITLHDWS
jgi:predicted choloylglycine hydrolase